VLLLAGREGQMTSLILILIGVALLVVVFIIKSKKK
jgi:prolipoprotein diacylglyceryltransferase